MLIQRIESDLKDAARSKDKVRLGTLRMLKSAIGYREIETGKPLSDDEVLAVLGTLIKQRRDSVAQFTAGGRPELAANETAEIAILETYLPQQLADAELVALVSQAVAATGAKGPREMGAVMKALKEQVQGRADGKRVSDAVKKALAAAGGGVG
ncbi:MAG: GatB/YqeY domain-containing protein [Myxococcales bacterium]